MLSLAPFPHWGTLLFLFSLNNKLQGSFGCWDTNAAFCLDVQDAFISLMRL